MASTLKTLAIRSASASRTAGVACCRSRASLSAACASRSICVARQPLRVAASATSIGYNGTVASSNTRPSSSSAHSSPPSSSKPATQASGDKVSDTPVSPQSTPPAAAAAPAAVAAASPTRPLDWNTFFQLRVRRRRVQLLFSFLNSLVGISGGAIVLSSGIADHVVKLIPLDPFLTLGLMTTACGALGWLSGPSVGSGLFYLKNRKLKQQIKLKESEFFEKIKKNRADPSNSSASNPGT